MRKWIYELIIIVVLLFIGGGIWWFNSTKDERKTNAQYEQLLKFANRQQIEITVIRQAAELEQLKRMLAQKPQQAVLSLTVPQSPAIADPDDTEALAKNGELK